MRFCWFYLALRCRLVLKNTNLLGGDRLFQARIVPARPTTINYLQAQTLLWLITWMVPGNGLLIEAAWHLLNLLIHHLRPPLPLSQPPLTCRFPFLLAHPLQTSFLTALLTHIRTYLNPSSADSVVGAGFKNVPHSIFPCPFLFFSLLSSSFSTLHPLHFPCPVFPPPSVCNQSPGNGRAAKFQFASALLRLKNQEELFFQRRDQRKGREGGCLEGVERKRRKCSSSIVACCMDFREGRRKEERWEGTKREFCDV